MGKVIKVVNSFSIEDLLWIEFDEGRISFRYKGMPDSVHFTFSWANPDNINFHITKNIGDGKDKPQIKIACWNQNLIDNLTPYRPRLIIGNMYIPFSFSQYSRKNRKYIRIIYFDEIESHKQFETLEVEASAIFKKHSSVKKKKKLRIKTSIERGIIPLFSSGPMKNLFLNNLRPLKANSFVKSCRCGIIFIENRKSHFVTYNNKCFILKERQTIQELLKFFMKPELVEGLTAKINIALVQIQPASTFADTISYNKPYKLFLEPTG